MRWWILITEAFRIAIHAITSHRLRTFLTMLGISIGIYAITVISTLVYSMQMSLTSSLSALGNTVLYVHNWPWKDNSEDWFKYFNRPKVNYRDFLKLKNNLKNVEGVSFEAVKNGVTLKSGGNSVDNARAVGVTYDYQIISDLKFSFGRFFSPLEITAGRNVCILGYGISRILFADANPIGRYIIHRGKRLLVIGILEKEGSPDIFGQSNDEMMIVPFPVMSQLYNLSGRRIDKVISIKAVSYEKVPEVESDIIGLIRAARGLKPNIEDNFSINKQEALMEELNSIFGALNTGGIFISLLALLVGGFGIANILFVSVKERTAETGIQKALGATREFILMQFLLEALLLCLLGGIVGIAFLYLTVIVATLLLQYLDINITVYVAFKDILIGIGLSLFIGLVSGIWPSYQAAKMDPVEAIRTK